MKIAYFFVLLFILSGVVVHIEASEERTKQEKNPFGDADSDSDSDSEESEEDENITDDKDATYKGVDYWLHQQEEKKKELEKEFLRKEKEAYVERERKKQEEREEEQRKRDKETEERFKLQAKMWEEGLKLQQEQKQQEELRKWREQKKAEELREKEREERRKKDQEEINARIEENRRKEAKYEEEHKQSLKNLEAIRAQNQLEQEESERTHKELVAKWAAQKKEEIDELFKNKIAPELVKAFLNKDDHLINYCRGSLQKNVIENCPELTIKAYEYIFDELEKTSATPVADFEQLMKPIDPDGYNKLMQTNPQKYGDPSPLTKPLPTSQNSSSSTTTVDSPIFTRARLIASISTIGVIGTACYCLWKYYRLKRPAAPTDNANKRSHMMTKRGSFTIQKMMP